MLIVKRVQKCSLNYSQFFSMFDIFHERRKEGGRKEDMRLQQEKKKYQFEHVSTGFRVTFYLPPADRGTHLTLTSDASICFIPFKCTCCRAFRDAHSCEPNEKEHSLVFHVLYQGEAHLFLFKGIRFKRFTQNFQHIKGLTFILLEPRLSRSPIQQ